jgi:hypothetical protein
MGLNRDDPQVRAFMAHLDAEDKPGCAEDMLEIHPVLFEALFNDWLEEQERTMAANEGQTPEPNNGEPDFQDHDPAVVGTGAWLRKHVPELQETAAAELAAAADRDYRKLFEGCGLAHRTLAEVCLQSARLAHRAHTGDLYPDGEHKGLVRPDTIVALSHDAVEEGIRSGPGYYSSFRCAVERELIVYLHAELGMGDPPAEPDLQRYERVCQKLYAAILLHERAGDTCKACTLVRRALDGFTASQGDLFHTLEDSIRRDICPLVNPDETQNEFQNEFGIPLREADVSNPEQWQWIVDHLEPPYV